MYKAKYSVERMCSALGLSRSGYYDWLKRKSKVKKQERLAAQVVKEFERSKRTYGSPRICEELNDKGVIVSKSTIARVMKSLRLQARPRRKFVHTTDSNHGYKVFDNELNRAFSATRLNEKWVSDITYIPTRKGWVYLTVILDLADKMVVAWTVSSNMTASCTTVACLKKAIVKRKITGKLLFHSDRGIQYCCAEFRSIIDQSKMIKQSMSRKANCWDNAPAESFFKTLKVEWTNRFVYDNIEQARTSVFDYIERWYNTRRKHSSIQYLSPKQKNYFLTEAA